MPLVKKSSATSSSDDGGAGSTISGAPAMSSRNDTHGAGASSSPIMAQIFTAGTSAVFPIVLSSTVRSVTRTSAPDLRMM